MPTPNVDKARKLVAKGKYDKAFELFAHVVDHDPLNTGYRLEFADLCLMDGRHDHALMHYMVVLQDYLQHGRFDLADGLSAHVKTAAPNVDNNVLQIVHELESYEHSDQLQTLLIGNKLVDAKRKELLHWIQVFFSVAADASRRHEILEALAQIEICMKYHFQEEELLQIEYDYPEYESHRYDHLLFIARFESATADILKSDNIEPGIGVIRRTISDWISEHMGTADQVFARFLEESGSSHLLDFLSD